MLTLADIDRMFPATKDGSLFSDMYKAIYGTRPVGFKFDDLAAFDKEFDYIAEIDPTADF